MEWSQGGKKVLIVEDNEDIAKVLDKRLQMEFFATAVMGNGMDVLGSLAAKQPAPDAIVLDLMIPGRTGHELLNTMQCVWPSTKVFVFSARQEFEQKLSKNYISGFYLKTRGIDALIEGIKANL